MDRPDILVSLIILLLADVRERRLIGGSYTMSGDDDPTDSFRPALEPGEDRGHPTLREQRRTFDRQIDKLREIDDKAMRTVRTAVLIIGFVVSAAGVVSQLNGVDIGNTATATVIVGVFLLLVTVFLGLGTYTATAYKGRLTSGEFARLMKPFPPLDSERKTLRSMYRGWTADAQQRIHGNSNALAAMQLAFLLAVVYLATAGFWVVIPSSVTGGLGDQPSYVLFPAVVVIPWIAFLPIVLVARFFNWLAQTIIE